MQRASIGLAFFVCLGAIAAVAPACSSSSAPSTSSDSGVADSRMIGDFDADASDASDARDGETSTSALPPFSEKLSEMGLYADFASKTISSAVVEYEPAYKLWSDGDEKRRWVWLPPGTKIDTSDMDHWVFPVGTRFFKEFAVGGKRIETRMIERVSAADGDYEVPICP